MTEAMSDTSIRNDRRSPPSPSYRMPPAYLLAMLMSVLTGRRRSFAADAEWLLGRFAVPPRLTGEEHIPARGPFVVVANHYQRPGLWVAWGALLVSMAVASRRTESHEVRWAMAGEWRGHLLGPLPWPAPFLRWLFGRIAATYGHIVVPAGDLTSAGRARAVRSMVRVLHPSGGDTPAPLGLLPEGRNSPDRSLQQPDASVGRLLLHLCRAGTPALPAAVCEIEGTLTVTFGPPVVLEHLESDDRAGASAALDAVMLAVARLLPPSMRGDYAGHAEDEASPPA